jgi:tripartite-type tricarboxylate transporter receptor subunit TctC
MPSLFLIKRTVLLLAACCALASSAPAQEEYPSRPIRMIVPVSAGGAPDVVARLLAQRLTDALKQPVLVENRPGAGERIGAEYVAKSAPDGYTVLVAPPGALVVAPRLYAHLGFNPGKFVPISILIRGHQVLVARPGIAAGSVQELVTLAKASPGKLTYASPGVGTTPHLVGELFRLAAQIQTTHVPYKGLAPALTDLLAGHVDFMFDNLGNSLAHIKAGRLKAFGIVSKTRLPELPDVPTVAEYYPSVVWTSWFGVVAPPGTPDAIAERLSREIAQALKNSDVVAKLHAMSFTAAGTSPKEAAEFLKEESDRWASVITQAGIKAE